MLLAMAGSARADSWLDITHFPRGSVRFTYQVYTSVCERADAAFSARPNAPAWWRSQRSNLSAYKSKTKAILPSYVAGYTADVSGVTMTMQTADVLLSGLKMPTNYFDYTPNRQLTGTGNPYTNAVTVAGGTNLPAGRTNWITLDYGWPGMTNIARVVVKTGGLGYNHSLVELDQTNRYGFGGGSPAGNTWTGATAMADSSYPVGSWPVNLLPRQRMDGRNDGGFYSAELESHEGKIRVDKGNTNAACSTLFWFEARAHGTFASWTVPYVEGWNQVSGFTTNTNTAVCVHIADGILNKPDPWFAAPSVGVQTLTGWTMDDSYADWYWLLDWSISGGFKYK